MAADITPVALVDDHNLVRKGLVSLVNTLAGYQVVLEAANGMEFTKALSGGPEVRIAIVDLNMPVMDGYATIAWLARTCPDVRSIALTFDGSEQAVIRAVREGARGFLLKDVEPEVFKAALDAVRDTGYYESDLVRAMATDGEFRTTYERQQEKVLEAITPKELEFIILACAPEEYTYEQIADQMGTKATTVETHRKHVFDRFGIKSKSGLVIFAYRWGIVKVNRD